MVIPTFIILGFFVVVFGLVTELINYIWIGGQPLLFPFNIIRKLVKVLFFPFRTIIHTFLK